MVRRKNKKKRQVKKEGITINLNINQPTKTTTKRRRRTSAPQKKQGGMNFRTGLDPNFRTFDPYIRSKVMEMEQNNNALQGNYLLKLKAIEDGQQRQVNNLNYLSGRYNQFENRVLALADAYNYAEDERSRSERPYDLSQDGFNSRGDGVDNSSIFVNKPALTGATNSVVNPSNNRVINPPLEEKNIQINFNKDVDSEGNITTPPPAIARSFSQEGEAVEVEIIQETLPIVDKSNLPEPLSSPPPSVVKLPTIKELIQQEVSSKTKLTKTNQGIVEQEVEIVPPITQRARGVKKGSKRGLYYTKPEREKYPLSVFNRIRSGEIDFVSAYDLDESVEYRKELREKEQKEKEEKEEKESKGGGK